MPVPKEPDVRVVAADRSGSIIYGVTTNSEYPGLHSARFNISWLESEEFRKFAKWRNIVIITVVILFIFIVSVCSLAFSRTDLQGDKTLVVILHPISGMLLMIMVMVGVSRLRQNFKDVFRDRYFLKMSDEISGRESQAASRATDGRLELPELWAATQTRIGYYHEIATTQAEQSFRVGIAAAIAGFAAVIALGVVAAFAANGTAAIAASVVGVAGAAMSAYIGSTFMKTQAQASEQLSKFFLQPVEFSRLLGAERLLQTLPPEQRAEAVGAVVKSIMTTPGKESDAKSEASS